MIKVTTRKRRDDCCSLPVHDVGQKVVVLQSVVDIHLLIVDGQRSGFNAPLLQHDNNKWNVNDFPKINDSKRETNKIRPNIRLQSRSTRSSYETPQGNCRSKSDGINNIPWKRQPSKHNQRKNQIEK